MKIISFLTATIVTLWSVATLAAEQPKTQQPNVVFFLVDDLGWMDIAANGSSFYETPNVDRLAAEGVRFTQAYAASPVCSPTRASVLTGKNPARINLTQWIGGPGNPDYERNLPLDEVVFPELLQKAGYRNCFLGKWHLNNRLGEKTHWPDKHGFDVNVAGHFRGGLYIKNKYFSPWDIPNIENGPDGEYITDRLASEAVKFIDAQGQDPFLLYFSFYNVHAPFSAPQPGVEKYERKKTGLGLTDAQRFQQKATGGKKFTVRKRQDHATYAAMVESMDRAVGTVLDKIKNSGLEKNTVVIFFSDNGGLSTSEGTPTANTPLRTGKGWLYEGGIRVPAIIKWPEVAEAGMVSDAVITSMDFYPTILDMAGLPQQPKLHADGKNLVPLLKQETNQVHDTVYFHYPHRSNQKGSPGSAIREGRYKLIVTFNDNLVELYDLEADVGEQKNLSDKLPKVRDRMFDRLKTWWRDVDARFPEGYAAEEEDTDWPGFRGAGAVGVADGFETAVRWDATNPDDKSILWKAPVPGLGHSCPTIVGDRIFVATAVAADNDASLQVGRGGNTAAADDNSEQSWMVLCFDKTSGKELWRQTAYTGIPKATRHAKATHANTTVAVDGDNVVAFFGSEGLFCFDLEGNLKWKKDLGVVNVSKYGIGWGYASSPAIYDEHIVLVCDDPEKPYIVALKLEDGEEVWRKTRKEDCERSWGTPLIHPFGDGARVVVNGWPWIVAYDLATGDEAWRIIGGGDNPVPSPFLVNNRLYLTSSHGGKSPIIAVRPDATGNISEADSPEDVGLIWRTEKGGTYMSTPVIVGDYLYLGNTNGVMRCFHAVTGEKIYEERIASGTYVVSSLVAAADKIYCAAEDGTVHVIKAGPEFEILASNRLGEPCLATPAISGGVLFFRTAHSLIAIGPNDQAATTNDTTINKAKPNILFIAVDDLRPSMGCYGDELAVTPHMDRLASQGMTFNRAYCQVAVCNPSRASLMTGLRPDTLGVWTLPIHFREAKPDAVTLPQWLRESGYAAVSHGKIYHNPTPDPQSWSEPIRDLPALPFPYPDGTRKMVREAMAKLSPRDWRKNNLRRPSTASPDLPDNELIDGARTDMCIEDLRRLGKSSQPFFLAMGYIRPHLAFVAPKKYWDMHDPEKLAILTDQQTPIGAPPFSMHNNSELSHYVDLINMPKPWSDRTLSEDKMRQLVHGYYACVSYVDAQIGRLLKALEEEGLRENTIVVLWSDHGWKLGEYRGWGKMTNYEIDARVPLIISAPGMETAGKQSDSLVELLDLYPTLCELTGVKAPNFVEGKSLIPVLRDPAARVHQSAVSQYYRKHEDREYMGYSLRTGQYRYIEWRDFKTGEMVERELYDHNKSEIESANQIESVSPDVVKQLGILLKSTHPPKKLEMVPAVHTSPSGLDRWPVDFTLKNETDVEVTVYPIVASGKRNRGRNIAPSKSHTYQARIGGTYVVESEDGTIHEIHSPSWPAKPVVIQKQR